MTTRQFYSEYWKPLLMTIIPTIIITGFTTFMSVRIAIATIQVRVDNHDKELDEIKHDVEIYQQSVFELQKDCQYIKGNLGIQTTRGTRQ